MQVDIGVITDDIWSKLKANDQYQFHNNVISLPLLHLCKYESMCHVRDYCRRLASQ